MTLRLETFALLPVLVERPWGGRRLERFGKELPPGAMIGESWEVADLPAGAAPTVDDPCSRVRTGTFTGSTIADVISRAGEELLGTAAPAAGGRFPLLVKLLDAREHLSVQVHPHDQYVANHPRALSKTESWYVVDADPGAELFLDVVDGPGIDDVNSVLGTQAIVGMLRRVPASVGDFHHVPAGLIHALGAGVMVAEVQTPSDTTFRIYDWDQEYGRAPRSLHPEESAASIRLHPIEATSIQAVAGFGDRLLVSNQHYWIREHRHTGGELRLGGPPGPRVLLVVAGEVVVDGLRLSAGATAIIPAASLPTTVVSPGIAVLLEVGIPA